MFDFIKNTLKKREGKKNYEKLLKEALVDGKLDKNEKEALEKEAEKYNLNKTELLQINRKGADFAFESIIGDQRITANEKKDLEKLTDYF